MLVGTRRAHYHCSGGRTPIDLKDDTAAEASPRRAASLSYLLSWLFPRRGPQSSVGRSEAISAVSRRRGPTADSPRTMEAPL